MTLDDWNDLEATISNLKNIPQAFNDHIDARLKFLKDNYFAISEEIIKDLTSLGKKLKIEVEQCIEMNVDKFDELLNVLAKEKLVFNESSKSLAGSAIIFLETSLLNKKNMFELAIAESLKINN